MNLEQKNQIRDLTMSVIKKRLNQEVSSQLLREVRDELTAGIGSFFKAWGLDEPIKVAVERCLEFSRVIHVTEEVLPDEPGKCQYCRRDKERASASKRTNS